MSDAKQIAIAALSTIAVGILGIGITVVAYKNQDKIKRWIFRADNTSNATDVDNSVIKHEDSISSGSNPMETNDGQFGNANSSSNPMETNDNQSDNDYDDGYDLLNQTLTQPLDFSLLKKYSDKNSGNSEPSVPDTEDDNPLPTSSVNIPQIFNNSDDNKSDDDNFDEMQRSLTTSMIVGDLDIDSPIAFPNFSADTPNEEKKAALLNIINTMQLPDYGQGIRGLSRAQKENPRIRNAAVTPTAGEDWGGLLFNKENCEAIIAASGQLEINQGHCCVDLGKVSKAYISGDYHGNINAAIEDIKEFLGDQDPDSVFIVTGDFTDRHKGYHDLAALLLSLQLYLPNRVILLEGNHEQSDSHVKNSQFAVRSVDGKFFDTSPLYPNRDTFALRLPLYCTLEVGNKKILCCHGAPAPQLIDGTYTLGGLKNQTYDRLENQLVSDTCWRDLIEGAYRGEGLPAPLSREDLIRFLDNNNIDMLVRGHQHYVAYKDLGDNKAAITLLSSPDFCSNGNTGGTVVVGTKEDGTGEASLRFHYVNGNTEMIPLSELDEKVMDARQLNGYKQYRKPLEGPPTSD